MKPSDMSRLIQPCVNRGVSFEINSDETMKIDGKNFSTLREAEYYLENIPRKDIKESS